MQVPERKSCPQRLFAATFSGLFLRGLKQLASNPLAPELFADKKKLDAKPIAKGFSRQSRKLPVRLVFQKDADGNILGCLAAAEIIRFQQPIDLMDIARISIICYSKIHTS